MYKKFSLILLFLLALPLSACSFFQTAEIPQDLIPTPTKEVAIVAKMPTATNFPKIGTPTPAPPTATPKPTLTPTAIGAPIFDDTTFEELMTGTIQFFVGVDAEVGIIDERATGGETSSPCGDCNRTPNR